MLQLVGDQFLPFRRLEGELDYDWTLARAINGLGGLASLRCGRHGDGHAVVVAPGLPPDIHSC
jgi:hypothetical protein